MPNPYEEEDGVVDNGITHSGLGSAFPDGTYRPIPIVWLTAALIMHGVALVLLMILLSTKAPIFTVLAGAMITFGIWHWTNTRGMHSAGTGWRVATVVLLALNWMLLALAAYT